MEILLRDVVLPHFVKGVDVHGCDWDDLSPVHLNARARTMMMEFDCFCQTCHNWESFLEQIVEGAAYKLGRWDLSQLVRPWCST